MEELIVETGAKMLVLENTHTRAGGTVLTPELTAELAGAAQRHGAYVHLDGARLFNAAVALGIPVSELAAPANTVAVSLNKGLCAPMGTILAGRTQVIELAHRTLRRLGGASVHKAGIAAAAALVALDTLVDRLADDHRRARELGALLQEIPGLEVEPAEIETNIVLLDVSGTELYPDEFLRLLAERGVLGMERDTSRVRFVTHRLIGDDEVSRSRDRRGAGRGARSAHVSDLQEVEGGPVDDVFHDLLVDDRHVRAEGRAGDRTQAVDRLSRREEREVGAEQQLVRNAVLDRAHERLVQLPAPVTSPEMSANTYG